MRPKTRHALSIHLTDPGGAVDTNHLERALRPIRLGRKNWMFAWTELSTKLFKNGNSQAVRIPAELAYSRWDIELVIERQGDKLRIRPPGAEWATC
jgi:hypothetical protein